MQYFEKIAPYIVNNNTPIGIALILAITLILGFSANRFLSHKLVILPERITGKKIIDSSRLTKLKMVKRLGLFLIYFLGISMALLRSETYKPVATALLASAGFIASVGGFAARDTVANMIAGITIAFSQPIRLNDYIKIEEVTGKVEKITFLYTIIKTHDNRNLIVPNSKVVSVAITNYSMESIGILTEAVIPVPYGSNIEKAKKVLLEITMSSSFYYDAIKPQITVYELDNEYINLKVTALAKDAKSSYALGCDIKEKVVTEFPKNSLSLGKLVTETVLN